MELEAAISQIKNLASTADEVGRIKIKNALQEAHSSLDTRFDILARVNYMASTHSHLKFSQSLSCLTLLQIVVHIYATAG